jgi:starch synthase (maltosyl-transferring)
MTRPALPVEGRRRVVIERVTPTVDGGRYPVKRVTGDSLTVEADIFADGHDVVAAVLRWRPAGTRTWSEFPMTPLGNDRWRATLAVGPIGTGCYTVEGWVDRFVTWRRDLGRRVEAEQDVSVELEIGAQLIRDAAGRAPAPEAARLEAWAAEITSCQDLGARSRSALDPVLGALAARYPDRRFATQYERELPVRVDRARARYSTWYEFFPRSAAPEPGQHGTLSDCVRRLGEVAEMGFDVLYLPPIHPIGETFRKGRNNAVVAQPGDVGSPWAIGGPEGGHTSVHPALGTLADFDRLIAAARDREIEIALDIAYQCTPDHPWVKSHPEWFRHRPDGTIQYAENPPKKYQDIYPIDFETEGWRELWEALAAVVLFWAARGVRIFRVDNPHTKAFPFWEWAIARVQSEYPDVIFLAEAFTRPKVMYRLAKLGFTQSYTYFAWRNTKEELTEYFTELTRPPINDFFRPNLWPNTPDILTEYLQFGGRPAFVIRLVLAATLGASYGIYGPAFELGERTPRVPGGEEYLDSEKYEVRHWNRDHPWSLRDLITKVNAIRRASPALQSDSQLTFHRTDNPRVICYSKVAAETSNVILVVVNLDVTNTQTAWLDLDLEHLGVSGEQSYQVHDLLGGGRFLWHGPRNFVELVPDALPAHIFQIRRRVRTERDFDYYL